MYHLLQHKVSVFCPRNVFVGDSHNKQRLFLKRALNQLVFVLDSFPSLSSTEIMGSNPTRGMDVCLRLFCVCVVLCS
jgi:hypothetical protein